MTKRPGQPEPPPITHPIASIDPYAPDFQSAPLHLDLGNQYRDRLRWRLHRLRRLRRRR